MSLERWLFSIDVEDLVVFLLRSLALAVVLPRRFRVGRSSPSMFDGVLLRDVFRECESDLMKECLFPSFSC